MLPREEKLEDGQDKDCRSATGWVITTFSKGEKLRTVLRLVRSHIKKKKKREIAFRGTVFEDGSA